MALRTVLTLGLAAAVLSLTACDDDQPSALDPQSQQASEIATVWWLMFAIGAAVFVLVCVLLGIALFSRVRDTDRAGTWLIAGGGVALPLVVMVVMMAATLAPLRGAATPDDESALTIEITGHQFWWEVRYPDEDIITANEIHIPVGETVRLELTSVDVIHSFWVPQLQGKQDLVPGQTNTLLIEARAAGTYRGQCAEFCGIQHANMGVHVVADPPDEFATWLEGQQADAPEPETELARQGQEIFLQPTCIACHAIRGTEASGRVGPDLTHLQSRRWIAAGTLLNTPENLVAWIANPQQFKPGNLMPESQLDEESLEALLAYLETLE